MRRPTIIALALIGSPTLTVNSYGPTITTITGDLSWTDKTMIGARLAGWVPLSVDRILETGYR